MMPESKMGDAHCDGGYWLEAQVIADYMEIPRLTIKK